MARHDAQPAATLSPKLVALFALSTAVSGAIASLFLREVPKPYMDEIFHIPQAQAYCKGQWHSWDPKLTTPPGLYLVSVALSRLPSWALPPHHPLRELCSSIGLLRGTNALLFSLLQLATYKLLSSSPLEARTSAPRRSALRFFEAIVVSLLPPLFFFQFLYYTDVGGAAAVMGMLAAARRERHIIAALLGFASLWFRQTNIIWVAFSLGASILTVLRRRGLYDPPASHCVSPFRTLASLPLSVLSLRRSDVLPLAPYAPVLLSFLAFLRWNGSIVLGDRSNHEATLHAAQPAYLLAFSLFFGWPALVSSLGGVSATLCLSLRLVTRPASLSLLLLSSALLALAVHSYTIAHPFLLADNRHYPFYLWRRLINRTPWSRYALVPLYVGSGALWSVALARTHSLLYLLGLVAASCLTLIPSPLIEPRYFLVPYLIMRTGLSASARTDKSRPKMTGEKGSNAPRICRTTWLLVEAAWYAAINAVTIYVFLYRPFPFTDAIGRQTLERFMW